MKTVDDIYREMLACFSEKTARSTGIVRTHGYELMQTLTGKGQA